MNTIKLGKLIEGPEQRDAIHIAIAPVSSDERVYPGDHVALVVGTTDKVQSIRGAENEQAIGIVDPFLTHPLAPGHKFWLLLYPQTITSLRHEWTHPAFESVKPAPIDAKAKAGVWLSSFCAEHNVPFYDLIEGVKEFVESSEQWPPRYVQQGSQSLRDGGAASAEFWANFTAYTGVVVPPNKIVENPFCCTC